MTHDASSGVHHLVMHYDEDPDTPVVLEKSIVIANHGCHTKSSSTLKRSAFGVWFAEDSVRVSLSPLPTIEAQTTSNDRDAGLQYQFPNPLHVLPGSKQSDGCPTRYNEALERIEEGCSSGTLIKEIILMTHCLYLIEMMNRDIWTWAKRDYQDEHGRKIPNWKLLKRLHEKMLELGGLNIKVDFWRVRNEENSNAEGLALEALHADEQGEGSRSGNEHKDMTIPTLRPCCEYRKRPRKQTQQHKVSLLVSASSSQVRM
jgi:hypothetical protein